MEGDLTRIRTSANSSKELIVALTNLADGWNCYAFGAVLTCSLLSLAFTLSCGSNRKYTDDLFSSRHSLFKASASWSSVLTERFKSERRIWCAAKPHWFWKWQRLTLRQSFNPECFSIVSTLPLTFFLNFCWRFWDISLLLRLAGYFRNFYPLSFISFLSFSANCPLSRFPYNPNLTVYHFPPIVRYLVFPTTLT